MALSQAVIDLIRDEIGNDLDFANNEGEETGNPDEIGTLETIYTDTNRGDYDVLRTAYICWRRRQVNFQSRGFDVATAGGLYSRKQRMDFLTKKVKEYEILVDTTHKAKVFTLVTDYGASSDTAEY